jgi:hypothetical protein
VYSLLRTAMTSTTPSADLGALLEMLDQADTAVRALYRQLADNPDLASEYEAGLRELQRKRLELAQQVGVAALAEWRAAPGERQSSLEESGTLELRGTLPSEPEPGPAVPALAEPASVEAPVTAPTPPPPASESPLDVPAPVSARQLEEFKAAFSAPASTPPIVPRKDDRTLLLTLATHVSIAEEVSTSGAFEHEVEQLERAASEERQKRWRDMSRDAQVRWLSLLVAWAKALEDDGVRLQESTSHVATAFRALRTFSIHDNPGFVHGFARTAAPRWGGTWRMDALYHLREIRPEPVPAPVKPKAPTRGKAAAAEEEEDVGPEQEELAGWPHLERVKGLRVALLGGEVREERRVALEQAFQFDSLEWVPTDRPRLVASLAERAARGTLDFILVTKFVRHKETEAIERSSQVPVLSLRHGYGVTTVRHAFEDYFSRVDDKKSAKRRSG